MDYKTTTLNSQLECKETLLPVFPELHFGEIAEDLVVFDSTAFYKERNLDEIDYKSFQRINKRYIESFIQYGDAKTSELFFLNQDGHILMNKELTFVFLAFAVPMLATYFNGLLGDLMANGVAYSDGYIMSLAAQRIPTDILQQIIEEREHGPQD
jgi:hypothetical protein